MHQRSTESRFFIGIQVAHLGPTVGGFSGRSRATEAYLRTSGVPYVILRNDWYTENYADFIAPSLARGVLMGSAGAGRICSAARRLCKGGSSESHDGA